MLNIPRMGIKKTGNGKKKARDLSACKRQSERIMHNFRCTPIQKGQYYADPAKCKLPVPVHVENLWY